MPSVAGAQVQSLTEAQALARLSSESPRVRALQAAIGLARADVLSAGRWPNPRLTFNRESVAGIDEHITYFEPVKDMLTLYHAVDALVMPSLFEGMPNAVLEAHACGLPAVVS